MPRLPDPYERRPIASGVRPVARIGNAGAVGAAVADLGQGLQSLGAGLDAAFERQRQEEAAAEAADAEVAASSRLRERLYDPDSGFLNTTGSVAVRGREGVLKDLDALEDEVTKGLSPEAVKRLRPVLMSKIESAKQRVDIHVSTQRTAWLNSASEARVANAIEDAKTRFGDPEAVQEHVGIAVAELKNRAEREGWPGEELDLAIESVRATVALSYLEQTIRSDPVAVMEAGRRGEGSVLAALIEVESGGNPEAVSPKGAVGLMQVMPDTAREIARELGDANFPADGSEAEITAYLKDPDVNTRYGEHYFRKQMRHYGGDVEAALIAYNGGPGRADAWLKAGRDDSVIPAETRRYYKKVLDRVETGGGGPVDVAFRQLPFDDQLKVVDRAERAASVEFKQFEDRFDAHIANIERFGVGMDGFSVEDASRFATPEQVAELRDVEARAQANHETFKGVLTAPPEEAVAILNETAPVPGSEDVVRQAEVHERALDLMQERRNATVSAAGSSNFDPAGYVRRNFPEVGEAWEQATESRDPADIERATELTLEMQERLGVSRADRRVLPKSVASAVVAEIQQTPSGERAQRLEAELALWGDNRNRALNDLRAAGLPDLAYIAALHVDNPAVAQRLSAAMETGVDALREGLEDTTVSDMRAQLNEEFREYREVFEAGDLTGSAAEEMNALLGAAEALAMQDIRRGADPATAARSARELLVDAQVAIVDGGRVTSLVPSQFRAGAVERGAEIMLDRERIEAMDVEPFGSVTGFGAFDEERTLRKIASDGQWFYSGDGETMTLMVPFASLSPSREIRDFIAVRDRSGERIRLSFAEAERLGVSAGAFGPVIRGGPAAVTVP